MKKTGNENTKKTMKKTGNKKHKKALNYPMDEHKYFCRRCYQKNGCCPKTRSPFKARSCTL